MKKVLFLPLFRMQSGHHQVAEALMDLLKKHTNGVILKKVDLLSYTNNSLEKVITTGYLKWIRYAPETYNLTYKNLFYANSEKERPFKWCQHIFLKKMEQLIDEENPDLIVCTHGFPSQILSQLKLKGKCSVPIINVYTDFFINNVWGSKGIDFHFIPSQELKEKLLSKNQIPKHSMMVTGIPVHEEITKKASGLKNADRPKVLISGGNSGLGGILNLAGELKKSTNFDYFVLCGNNKKLFDEIKTWDVAHIKPLPYISSRSEMNKLYEEVDVIVTKPGGVTISEALRKRLPIFVHSMLPGQEEINLQYLKDYKLVFEINRKFSFEKQMVNILKDHKKMDQWDKSIETYQKEMELENPEEMVSIMKLILNLKQVNKPSYLTNQSKVIYS
ncbi:MGDG synthase family glycosyltransferase [Peribacillus sp. NPDC006672]|uniref:MGDG synthase family glycosyltransferase n=1 Tax=Peribacillus sp. NPDC006672 TaxID=3390606 RepID=UPI003D05656A